MISIENKNRLIFGLIFISCLYFGVYFSALSCSILFALIGIICIYEMLLLRKGKSKFFAITYTISPFILIQILIWKYLSINTSESLWSPNIILQLLILTWVFDTFAYVFGVKFGKNKIMPSISPKKSWEGLFGGMLFTILASFLIFEKNYINIILFAVLVPISATLGDFIESFYKRQAGVKDSGKMIPGHGGMLDRMDSLLISISVISLIIITNIR